MNNITLALFLFVAAFIFVACNTGQNAPANDSSKPTITVKDAKYGDQNVPLDPQKIVSFDYGALDTLLALGLESKIAGLPKSNLPELLKPLAAEKYVDAGTLFEPNYEKLYTIKPDLIIVSGRAAAKIEELRKIAPTIYYEPKNEDYYNTFKANTELLGKILKKEDLVKEKLAEVDKKLAALTEKTKNSNQTGLISLYTAGKVSVYGQSSRFGVLHQAFGVKPADPNIQEAAQHGQVVNFEYFKKVDPDYIFVIDRAKILGEETLAQTFFDNDVIKSTKAAQNNKIVYLNAENWYTVSGGIQSMTKMIEEISTVIK